MLTLRVWFLSRQTSQLELISGSISTGRTTLDLPVLATPQPWLESVCMPSIIGPNESISVAESMSYQAARSVRIAALEVLIQVA